MGYTVPEFVGLSWSLEWACGVRWSLGWVCGVRVVVTEVGRCLGLLLLLYLGGHWGVMDLSVVGYTVPGAGLWGGFVGLGLWSRRLVAV